MTTQKMFIHERKRKALAELFRAADQRGWNTRQLAEATTSNVTSILRWRDGGGIQAPLSNIIAAVSAIKRGGVCPPLGNCKTGTSSVLIQPPPSESVARPPVDSRTRGYLRKDPQTTTTKRVRCADSQQSDAVPSSGGTEVLEKILRDIPDALLFQEVSRRALLLRAGRG